jgi:hypothetical protein
MNGVPLAVVARILGHKNIQMTMRYSHLYPGNHERAIAAMMSIYEDKTGTATGAASAGRRTPLHGMTPKQNRHRHFKRASDPLSVEIWGSYQITDSIVFVGGEGGIRTLAS